MKLWVDDIRPAPEDWCQAYSVNAAKEMILANYPDIYGISLDKNSNPFGEFSYLFYFCPSPINTLKI